MPTELMQMVLTLTFFGICGLAGEIMVQRRKERDTGGRS
jgi:hypothetical protein